MVSEIYSSAASGWPRRRRPRSRYTTPRPAKSGRKSQTRAAATPPPPSPRPQPRSPLGPRCTHSKRAQLLSKVADVLAARQKEFQEALIDEGGAWIGKTMFETGYSIGVYRAAAAAAYQVTGEILPSDHGKMSLVVREPLGVVSVISPWNFPLILSSRGFAVGARRRQHAWCSSRRRRRRSRAAC